MHLFVVSDLHLGSSYFLHDAFLHFLTTLPQDSVLVLNGDVIDRPQIELPAAHQAVITQLRQESYRRQVVWIRGNHDEGYMPSDPGHITFAQHFSVDQRLLIVHGDGFDRLLPNNRWFVQLFKFGHELRMRLGAPPLHVACYAKKWAFLYRVFTRHVRKNAVRWAKAKGFAAITCGHTHFPEDVEEDGVRYINTGSWTETPAFYLWVTPTTMSLQKADALEPRLLLRSIWTTRKTEDTNFFGDRLSRAQH